MEVNNKMLQELQIELDNIKSELLSINNYATLSGLNALSRHHIINPYLVSMQTGISHTLYENGHVKDFSYNFVGLTHKHYIDDYSLKDCKGTSTSNFTVYEEIPSGDSKAIGGYASEEISSMAEQAKIKEKIEETMVKQAEKDFFAATLIAFKEDI